MSIVSTRRAIPKKTSAYGVDRTGDPCCVNVHSRFVLGFGPRPVCFASIVGRRVAWTGGPYLKECGRQAFLRQNIHIPSLPALRQNARRWLENLVLSLTAYADREHDEPTFVQIHRNYSSAVGLCRIRGVAHVLIRRPSPDRRRGPPTHTFVLSPQHARCGWEAA